jgi:hypothetical protein
MSTTARAYLVNRFRTDAAVLRERVAVIARGTKVPGPDAATSSRMADACDEVVTMLLAIAGHEDADAELDAIMALVPLLEHRASGQTATPAVRSVFAGAATRIREVRSAEAQAASSIGVTVGVTDRLADSDVALEGASEGEDVDEDDADVDDDDLAFDDDAFGPNGAP